MGKTIEILVICLIVAVQLFVTWWTYRQICTIKNLITSKKSLRLQRYVLTPEEVKTLSPREIVEGYRYDYDEWKAKKDREKGNGDQGTILLRNIDLIQDGNDKVFILEPTKNESESIFQMTLINDNEAEIDVLIAPNKKEERLKDLKKMRQVCDIQAATDSPTSYINMSPGWCKRITDNKWMLVRKCKISII